MMWLLLTAAILTELSATLCLRLASQGKSIWYIAVGAGYLLAFTLLSLTLDQGMNLGVAYGTWAAAGVALTAIASRILFKEHLTPVMIAGLGLIIAGVLLIELGAAH
ncbi:SMR family transporter [Arthrobacter sp. K5]|uniref:SMR family transporter n=1 Tax=Arthrobacter sp. K5 TaxID=2839623 RepID=A0AAU8EN22_9MICC